MQSMLRSWLILSIPVVWCGSASAVSREFSVQGVLRNGAGQLQSTMIEVRVRLYGAQTDGAQIGPDYAQQALANNGLFTVLLSAPSIATDLASVQDVWLEVTVDADTFPRQKVTSEPLAQVCDRAEDSTSLGGQAASLYLLKLDAANSYLAPDGDGSQLTNLDGAALQSGTASGSVIAPGAIVANQIAANTLTASHVEIAGGIVSSATVESNNLKGYSATTAGNGVQGTSIWCPPNQILILGGCLLDGSSSPPGNPLVNFGPFVVQTNEMGFLCNWNITDGLQHIIEAQAVCYPHP